MQISKEFQTALNEALAALEQRAKVENLISTDRKRLQTAKEELQKNSKALEAAEADAAINGTVVSSSASFKRQRVLRDEVEQLSARISGLEARLIEFQDLIVQKNDSLVAARSEFTRTIFEAFAQEYESAAGQYMAVARKGAALADVLGSELPGLARVCVPNLLGPGDLAGIFENKLIDGVWQRFIRTGPEVEALVPMAQKCSRIDREAQEIRKQIAERQRVQREAQRELEPLYRSASLPLTEFNRKRLEHQEAVDQALRDQARFQVEPATQYPNDSRRRNGVTAARLFPNGVAKT